ncbi:MAG: DUF3592 domain-containing protein [Bacteroidota bacterium]
MKRILLLAAAIVAGLFANSLLQQPNHSATSAEVLSIQKIRNTRKGDKPFVYRVHLLYETSSGRKERSTIVSRQLPSYSVGEIIDVQYHPAKPNRVQPMRTPIRLTKKSEKTYL